MKNDLILPEEAPEKARNPSGRPPRLPTAPKLAPCAYNAVDWTVPIPEPEVVQKLSGRPPESGSLRCAMLVMKTGQHNAKPVGQVG